MVKVLVFKNIIMFIVIFIGVIIIKSYRNQILSNGHMTKLYPKKTFLQSFSQKKEWLWF